MASIGLAMIARDEATVIRRALDSVRPLIDYVVVCDTGSIDNTPGIVKRWLADNGVAGTVLAEEWRDFAHNRSLALAALRQIPRIDYALLLDADDVLQISGDVATLKAGLNADLYTVEIRHATIVHRRPQIVSNRKPFGYRGVVHETLDCAEPFTSQHLDGVIVQVIGGGVRSRSPDTYRHDAEQLAAALANGQDPDLRHRYQFYLAQSWRDAGEPGKALAAYLVRAEIGGWIEEVYVSLLHAARLQEQLAHPLGETITTYRRAIAVVPHRAEALHGLARLLRLADLCHEACAVAERGITLAQPQGLFVEVWIYQYGLLEEYAVSAYRAGYYAACWLASQVILHQYALDPVTTARVRTNAELAKQQCQR